MTTTRRSAIARIASASAAMAALPSLAQAYPSKPIRLIVPVAAAGAYDGTTRLVARHLSAALGQSIVVENMPGAEARLANGFVARAPADGYTLLMAGSALVQNTVLSRENLPYKLSDFATVGQVTYFPLGFAVQGSLGANTLQEFVTVAKRMPGKLSFGSIAVVTRALGENLNKAAGIDLLHVPYKGEAPVLNDLLGGHLQTGFMTAAGLRNWYASDKIKWLAVNTPKRLTRFPNVPTFADAGYPSLNVTSWIAIVAPQATPRDIVARLSAELDKVMHNPEVVNAILELGVEPYHRDSAALQAFFQSEVQLWERMARELPVLREG